MKTHRRQFVKSLTAGLVTAPWGIPYSQLFQRQTDSVGDLAEKFRSIPQTAVFDVAVDAVKSGASYKTILAAVFVAGVHEIRPRPVGSKLHAVMMIESAFQIADSLPNRQAFVTNAQTMIVLAIRRNNS